MLDHLRSKIGLIFLLVSLAPFSNAKTQHKKTHHATKGQHLVNKQHPAHPAGHKKNYDPMAGTATYYASKFSGRRTTSGSRLDMSDFMAAHPSLPMGTKLKVTNVNNGKTVYVEVVDRMPHRGGRVIDLTEIGARQIGIWGGMGKVQLERVSDNEFNQQVADQCRLAANGKPKSIASQVEIGSELRQAALLARQPKPVSSASFHPVERESAVKDN